MRILWFCALATGCAVTASTCPSGTKLTVVQKPEGRAQWCAVTDSTVADVPMGRSFEGALGVGLPVAMPGGVEGPFTSWYPDGHVQSHGQYANYGGRSVPEGLWAFWHPNGQRWVLGMYHRGEPTGCFASWDESGKQSTGTVVGGQLHMETCTPPPDDDDLAAVEGHARPRPESHAWGDISLEGTAGPNQLGAANAGQLSSDPDSRFAFTAAARKRFGRLRVGPTAGLRMANDAEGSAVVAGASIGWQLPSFHPRFDTEVSADLAVQRISLTAERKMQPGVASVSFWSPLPGAQAAISFALSPSLAVLAGFRVDGVPARSMDRDVVYCDFFFGCTPPVHETWQIGGFSFGVDLGLRLLIE